jgi:hypothetical protein
VTAVLAAAARAVIHTILGLAYLVWILWAALSHTGFATVAWLAVVFVTIAGSGAALESLGNRRRTASAPPPCGCLCGCPGPGRTDGDGVVCDPCRMNIHQEA